MVNVHASTEKVPVVLDIGSAYTKAGYGGDAFPTCIIPSKATHLMSEIWLRDVQDSPELRTVINDFLRYIYLNHLLVSMNERPVIVCESLLCSSYWKRTLAAVLFEDFGVPAIIFAPKHLLALYTLGITSAMVLHSGYQESIAIPVYENMVLLNAYQSLELAGKAIEESIAEKLSLSGKVAKAGKEGKFSQTVGALSQNHLEDIKVKTCFITRHDRAAILRRVRIQEQGIEVPEHTQSPEPPKGVDYPLDGETVIHISGKLREEACEVLYEQDHCEQTLAYMILDCLLKCPIDSRKVLAENIVLIGGTCMLPGFKHRLQQELLELSIQPQYKEKMNITKFCFHTPPARENYVAWLGGSILGSSGHLDAYSVSKAQFKALKGVIPDWSTYDPKEEKDVSRKI